MKKGLLIMDILLSVIVPVYNVETYLEKCIYSIINQTYNSLEIILIDDGSTDSSAKICDKFAFRDKRIKVLHKINGGLVSARKAGAELARGDYIINVDGDDWVDVCRFENLVKNGLVEEPDMVYMGGILKEYENKSVLILNNAVKQRVYYKTEIRTDLMRIAVGNDNFFDRRIWFGQVTWAIKRELYIKNQTKVNEDISMGEDAIMVFPCILESEKIVCLDEPSYHYTQRCDSIVHEKTEKDKFQIKMFYMQMKEILNSHLITKDVLNVAVQLTFQMIVLKDYTLLYNYYQDYMFPYHQVVNGSRIIVYGAGELGVNMVNAIECDNRHKVVAWVDKNPRNNRKSTHKVESISEIEKNTYDFIVVAILVSQISMQVKRNLVNMGVDKDKVVLMDSKLMNMEDLECMLN
jgi:glycosyltransferase involved in cell wall biosynthesis